MAGSAQSVHGPDIKGCAFHFGQALWRKCQEIGLSTAYESRDREAVLSTYLSVILRKIRRILTYAYRKYCKPFYQRNRS
ncbi:hypothetical protein DPMN_105382 [Dreissena polymorpha]|uniref:Uncharacterized protein n=1 Tax=Dreissena polymorpha TaxID=45954 RepID=A0A9D4HBQ0_DREPO|nr:hypothetical protein DPMN_105382 [Dreissena polymorpha]